MSDSDFHIDLPMVLLMPEDTGFYIEDICLPIIWYTIEEGINDGFGFACNNSPRFETIRHGNYTTQELGEEIVRVMNLSVRYSVIVWSHTYIRSQNAIRISYTSNFLALN